jgi:hypothetical protein
MFTNTLERNLLAFAIKVLNKEGDFVSNIPLLLDGIAENAHSTETLFEYLDNVNASVSEACNSREEREFALSMVDGISEIMQECGYDTNKAKAKLKKMGFEF